MCVRDVLRVRVCGRHRRGEDATVFMFLSSLSSPLLLSSNLMIIVQVFKNENNIRRNKEARFTLEFLFTSRLVSQLHVMHP